MVVSSGVGTTIAAGVGIGGILANCVHSGGVRHYLLHDSDVHTFLDMRVISGRREDDNQLVG